eukprot:409731-Pyramimonas_sp.AAC.1
MWDASEGRAPFTATPFAAGPRTHVSSGVNDPPGNATHHWEARWDGADVSPLCPSPRWTGGDKCSRKALQKRDGAGRVGAMVEGPTTPLLELESRSDGPVESFEKTFGWG